MPFDHGHHPDGELQTVAMNETLNLVNHLLTHPEELASEMEHCGCRNCESHKALLLKLIQGEKPRSLADAENHRKLVRILRGL